MQVWESLGLYCCVEQDEFASLPAIVPEGPIAILGLVSKSFQFWSYVRIL